MKKSLLSNSMEDRISALPDSLISHILSFLPTEQAIATSILSKQWRPLWRAITALNFDDENYSLNKDTYLRFLRLVNTVLLLRGGEQPIMKFDLKCESSFCDPSDVNTWVMASTLSKLDHLTLSLPSTVSLSFGVFTNSNLVVLKLSGEFTVHKNHSSVSFPSLKILHLTRICFEDYGYVAEILASCPVLEVLEMKYLQFGNCSVLAPIREIHLPNLVKADISRSNIRIPWKSFYNVEFLRARVSKREGLPTHNFSHLSYLELLHSHYFWVCLIELLRNCPLLQTLVIDKRSSISYNKLYKSPYPLFVPECIISKLKRFRFIQYEAKEEELLFSRFILQNARVLRKVTICSGRSSNPQEKLQMIKDLSLSPRGSDICELYFE